MSAAVESGRRRGRLGRRLAALAAAPALAAFAVLGMPTGGSGDGGGKKPEATPAPATAAVERKTLVEREEVEGTLGYGKSRRVTNRGQGTLTDVAAEGSVVQRNGVLYELDNKGVRLFYGDTPAYRRLAADSGNGPDIKQLEANLKELGFAKGLIGKPDEKWDEGTTAAVKRWQKSIGVDQDGVIEDGEIVFLPAAARVSSTKAETGTQVQPGGTVLEVTGTTRQVSLDLDARKQRLVEQGAKVEIALPDGSTTTGTVSAIGTVAKSAGSDDDGDSGKDSSKATVAVTVMLDDAGAGGSLDGAPVKVRFTRASREGVLAVPVNSLLALSEGGYGVEVYSGGQRRLVRVETGCSPRATSRSPATAWPRVCRWWSPDDHHHPSPRRAGSRRPGARPGAARRGEALSGHAAPGSPPPGRPAHRTG